MYNASVQRVKLTGITSDILIASLAEVAEVFQVAWDKEHSDQVMNFDLQAFTLYAMLGAIEIYKVTEEEKVVAAAFVHKVPVTFVPVERIPIVGLIGGSDSHQKLIHEYIASEGKS